MELLPDEIKTGLPALYSQTGVSDPIIHAKLRAGIYCWFVIEYDHVDQDTCFGYICEGEDGEFGYFSLDALQRSGADTSLVTRDMSFAPKPLSLALSEEP